MKAFIEEKASAFYPKLKINYVRGADPSLRMITATGDTETISLVSWTTDNLNDYLVKKLA